MARWAREMSLNPLNQVLVSYQEKWALINGSVSGLNPLNQVLVSYKGERRKMSETKKIVLIP